MSIWENAHQILKSIAHELKLIVSQGTITAVALAAISAFNSTWLVILHGPCEMYAIFKTCTIHEAASTRKEILPSARQRLTADVLFLLALMALSFSVTTVQSELPKTPANERYSTMFTSTLQFLYSFKKILFGRVIFLFYETFSFQIISQLTGITTTSATPATRRN